MQINKITCSILLALLVGIAPITAQVFRITTYGYEGLILGDITKKDFNSSTAGYVEYGSGGGLELNAYLKNNLGFGLRWSGTYFERDMEAYQTDLKAYLGITDDQYDITQSYAYWSFGSALGISYLLDISEKLQFEPYFYFGFRVLASPINEVIYLQNSTTYQHRTKAKFYPGISYTPGIKLQWNIWKHAGLNFFLEYDGNSFMKDDQRSMTYSYNSLDIVDTEKNYSIHAVNLGLGLAFRFGKGLRE